MTALGRVGMPDDIGGLIASLLLEFNRWITAWRIEVSVGHIMYLGSTTTAFPTPSHGLYAGSKIAPQHLMEVLAKELGACGITVNSILPAATEGAGISAQTVRPHVREYIKLFNLMGRIATVGDMADAVEHGSGDLAGYVSGRHLLLSGGAPA